jgi:phosphopantothenoylcysteine decarboxylase/phosphopantothenate--cysteine ligase
MFFQGKHIVLGVCGGIAAYKSGDFIRELQRLGCAGVHPILSQDAPHFVTALTLSSLSKYPATSEHHAVDAQGVPLHISLAQWGDALLIYPATAHVIAQLAQGLTGDLVTASALCFNEKPIVLSPAMNTRMWEHPLTQRNLAILASLPNVLIVPPTEGLLACGETGAGHLAPDAWTTLTLYKAMHPHRQRLEGKKVLVTAGGTQEAVDPARILTNHSSGKMGLALADEAYAMGAEITLITANEQHLGLRPFPTILAKDVESMKNAVLEQFPSHDWLLKAAAVSDFKPVQPQGSKIKKHANATPYVLELEATVDILKTACEQKHSHQKVLGFAAESETGDLQPLYDKLKRKGADALAVNNIQRSDIAFHSEENEVQLLFAQDTHAPVFIEKAGKDVVARHVLAQLADVWL